MKTKPMSQQTAALQRLEGKRNFALLMEMGTGKTWTILADAERCYLADKINALLIVAPKGVHTNWIRREIPEHLSAMALCYEWKGTPTSKKAKTELASFLKQDQIVNNPLLRIFAMNIDAVNTASGYEAAVKFLMNYKVMIVVDESTRIKNPKAKRSEKVIALGRLATARRILSGAPITKSPIDLFNQFEFLKPGLLNTTSYRAFVAEYAVLIDPASEEMAAIVRASGPKAIYAQIVKEDRFGNKMWKNLDRLTQLITPHAYRIRKDECLDLPPKVYKEVFFDLEGEQRAVYTRMAADYHYHDIDTNRDLSFAQIATITKLKQITSGYINIDGTPKLIDAAANPRMRAFKEVIEDVDGPFIVWAMYKEEIRQIVAVLEEAGISSVEFHGDIGKEDREKAIDGFQSGEFQAFVGHAQAGGIGVTLTAARLAIYYSCSYDNELRIQSEDRCHRIGTKHSVLYIDLVAEDTVDEDVLRSLKAKTAVAHVVIDGISQEPA